MEKNEKVWASRKIARKVARARMQHKGVQHINKHPYVIQTGLPTRMLSYFARNWRKFAQ